RRMQRSRPQVSQIRASREARRPQPRGTSRAWSEGRDVRHRSFEMVDGCQRHGLWFCRFTRPTTPGDERAHVVLSVLAAPRPRHVPASLGDPSVSIDRSAEMVGPATPAVTGSPTHRASLWRRRGRDRFALAGGVVVVAYALVALAAPLVTRALGVDPYTYDLDALGPTGAPAGPAGGISSEHWFG